MGVPDSPLPGCGGTSPLHPLLPTYRLLHSTWYVAPAGEPGSGSHRRRTWKFCASSLTFWGGNGEPGEGGKQRGIRQHHSTPRGPAPWPRCTGLPTLHRLHPTTPSFSPASANTDPCQAPASAGRRHGAQHPCPTNPLRTLEHPICSPAKGTDTLAWLLATWGFPSHHALKTAQSPPPCGYLL